MALNIISEMISCGVLVHKPRTSVWFSSHHECSINIIVKPIDCIKLPLLQKKRTNRQLGFRYIHLKRQAEICIPILAQSVWHLTQIGF